ncbi:UNVERIFIED_CONTAM: hypothetical protein FKN15_027117 [Acipenser sinensis]
MGPDVIRQAERLGNQETAVKALLRRDRDLAKGDPGALDGASGAQAGDQSAAAPGRGASPGDCEATSGQPGGAEQETRRPPVPGGAATWESGPATRGPDMQPRCLGAQVEGTNP